MTVGHVCCAAMIVALAGASAARGQPAARVRAIYTNIPGHPTRQVPGVPGGLFNEGVGTQFERPFVSPDGTRWAMRARLAPPAVASNNDIVIAGSGVSGASGVIVMREGSPTGLLVGEVYGTPDTVLGIDNTGRVAFSALTTAPPAYDAVVVRWAGSGSLVAREGSTAPGTGGGLYGTPDSVGILADGTVYFRTRIAGGPRDGQVVLYRGGTIVAAAGDPAFEPAGQLLDPSYPWRGLYSGTVRMDASGAHWACGGEVDSPDPSGDQVLAVDNTVRVQEGSVTPGDLSGRTVAASTATPVVVSADGGRWIGRSAYAGGDEFVVASGAVVAVTDGLITARATGAERYDDSQYAATFFLSTVNSAGDWVVGGVTDAADQGANAVLVLNGQRVLVREGDPVDLNGNGLADDGVFIAVFNNDDAVLTDPPRSMLYFTADLRDSAGAVIGQGFLAMSVCRADWDGSGAVTSTDVSAFLREWLASAQGGGTSGDFDHDGAATSGDIAAFLSAWIEAVTVGC